MSAVPVCVWTGWKAATVPRHAIASVKVTTVFIIVAVALLSGVSMYQAVRTRKSAENPDTLPCVPIFADDFSEVYLLGSDVSGRRLREKRSVSRRTRNPDNELLGLDNKKENEAT